MSNKLLISESRNYNITIGEQAKEIVEQYLKDKNIHMKNITFGLAEIIDRYNVWNVPVIYWEYFSVGDIMVDAYTGKIDEDKSSQMDIILKKMTIIEKYKLKDKKSVVLEATAYLKSLDLIEKVSFKYDKITLLRKDITLDEWYIEIFTDTGQFIGEFVYNAYTGIIDLDHSTDKDTILLNLKNSTKRKSKKSYPISPLDNLIIQGDSSKVLYKLPAESIDLIFTSPPYYNAKKEYSEYSSYEDYLNMMRDVIRACKRVLVSGKFFVMNSSHVMIPRASRSESSRRIGVPFDLHQIFIEEGFEFVDDIIWQKPEGAGWSSGRGRRFSADRNAMQYKAVPVTEYVMVYRKKSNRLIDYFIRNHPNPELVENSKILGEYDVTNIWYISPDRDRRHPAIFPRELAKKVIKYYSFKNDVVLDPFAGLGTTGKAAIDLGRKYCLVERDPDYIGHIKNDINSYGQLFTGGYDFRDYSNLVDEEYLIREEEVNNDINPDIFNLIKLNMDLEAIANELNIDYKILVDNMKKYIKN